MRHMAQNHSGLLQVQSVPCIASAQQCPCIHVSNTQSPLCDLGIQWHGCVVIAGESVSGGQCAAAQAQAVMQVKSHAIRHGRLGG